jgi:hypothetical protein
VTWTWSAWPKALRKAKFTPVVLSVGPEEEKKTKPDKKKPEPAEPKKPPCCAGSCPPPPPVAPWPGKVVYCEQAKPGCIIL